MERIEQSHLYLLLTCPGRESNLEAGVSVAEFSRLRAKRPKVILARLGYVAWRAGMTLAC
jgi:hypothetical protein